MLFWCFLKLSAFIEVQSFKHFSSLFSLTSKSFNDSCSLFASNLMTFEWMLTSDSTRERKKAKLAWNRGKKTEKRINDVWNRLVENCVFFSGFRSEWISHYFKPNSHYLRRFMLLLSVNVISSSSAFWKASKTFSGKYLFYDEVLFAIARTCWVGKSTTTYRSTFWMV